jgi:hypothetical protein
VIRQSPVALADLAAVNTSVTENLTNFAPASLTSDRTSVLSVVRLFSVLIRNDQPI